MPYFTGKMEEKICSEINGKEIILDVIISEENYKGKTFFVARGIELDVASQGRTIDEALSNLKEAVKLALENEPVIKQELIEQEEITSPMMTRILI